MIAEKDALLKDEENNHKAVVEMKDKKLVAMELELDELMVWFRSSYHSF